MNERSGAWVRIAGVLGLGLALAGCAAGGGWAAGALALMAAAMLAVSGCSSSHSPEDGTWQECCVEGRIDTCFCPADAICNYGWYNDCGDGTCTDPSTMCPVVDAGVPDDAGGSWESCCVEGRIDTCFCPAGVACNYGWYNDCGDGTCTDPTTMCPAPDAGPPPPDAGVPPDAGGTWDPCCVDGVITTCHCPPGVACNYWFVECGEGTCADPRGSCPP